MSRLKLGELNDRAAKLVDDMVALPGGPMRKRAAQKEMLAVALARVWEEAAWHGWAEGNNAGSFTLNPYPPPEKKKGR